MSQAKFSGILVLAYLFLFIQLSRLLTGTDYELLGPQLVWNFENMSKIQKLIGFGLELPTENHFLQFFWDFSLSRIKQNKTKDKQKRPKNQPTDQKNHHPLPRQEKVTSHGLHKTCFWFWSKEMQSKISYLFYFSFTGQI